MIMKLGNLQCRSAAWDPRELMIQFQPTGQQLGDPEEPMVQMKPERLSAGEFSMLREASLFVAYSGFS